MPLLTPEISKIAVIGLGYVGLPLALALSRHFSVVGFDAAQDRVDELRNGNDRTGEVPVAALRDANLSFSAAPADIGECNIFIVTVPTPIDDANQPDLSALRAASKTVGESISPGSVVVYESTVYPGVTEDVCGPEVEKASGLNCGTDFFLGYSPERINPGDTTHTVDKIVKVVAGQTPEVADLLAEIYGAAVPAGIHVAPNIKTAEAAKVIENAQRDINIAFVNEIAMIFRQMDIDTQDVLAAARTKWNFLDFRPGLVGGHCIGVDPYYLAHAANAIGHEPEVILAGRRTNDGMAGFVASRIDSRLNSSSSILILGLTFKENVPDLRNSKVADMIENLQRYGHQVDVHDAIADPAEARSVYGLELLADLPVAAKYDAIVGAVAHDTYRSLSDTDLRAILADGGTLFDLKGMWRDMGSDGSVQVWRL